MHYLLPESMLLSYHCCARRCAQHRRGVRVAVRRTTHQRDTTPGRAENYAGYSDSRPYTPSMDGSAVGYDARLRSLVEAGIELGAEFSLDGMLQRIVDTAARLTGARYAALGVIDASGRELERFVTAGLTPDELAAIGPEPKGRGILGVLIRHKEPLRLRNLAEDPRSVGFPPGHPSMTSFLGVPIIERGAAYGNIYLTDKNGGDEFTDEDEDIIRLLAAQAAAAITNQRAYTAARTWAQQLQSLARIGDALVQSASSDDLNEAVVREFQSLLSSRLSLLYLLDLDGALGLVAAVPDELRGQVSGPLPLISRRFADQEARWSTIRIDALADDPSIDQVVINQLGGRTAILVPVTAGRRFLGVLVALDRQDDDPRFTDSDVRVGEEFAARAAMVIELSRRVTRESVDAILAAQEQERRRIGLELHDQTGQELTAALLSLGQLAKAVEGEDGRSRVHELRDLLTESLRGVRRLSTLLTPPALERHGLVAAVEYLAELLGERSGIAIRVVSELEGIELGQTLEARLYRVVQEALTNVVRHSGAGEAWVRLEVVGDRLVVSISDDGVGMSPAAGHGVGLDGARERMSSVSGALTIDSQPGKGTIVRAEVQLS
jgi:signal transduction histidine kinase